MTLENLLNSLIEEGWKPFGIEKEDIEVVSYDKNRKKFSIWYMNWSSPSEWDYDWLFMSLRDMTIKESWLRQFCCDKWFVEMYEWWYWQNIFPLDSKEYDYTDYQYWILESSLIDEKDLEKFLLDNIKVWNEK